MRIIDCRVLWCEVKKISQKDQEAIVFTHGDCKQENDQLVELYACKRYCKILQEGPPDHFFIHDSNDGNDYVNGGEKEMVEIPAIVHANTNSTGSALTEIVSQLQNQGFFIDDNNLSVPYQRIYLMRWRGHLIQMEVLESWLISPLLPVGILLGVGGFNNNITLTFYFTLIEVFVMFLKGIL